MAKQKEENKKTPDPQPVEAPKPVEPAVTTSMYTSKIEAIKDIIFGEDYAALRQSLKELDEKYAQKLAELDQKYTLRTAQLEEKFDNKIADLDDRLTAVINDLDRTLNHKIDEVEMDLKSEIDRLDHHKTDRFKLGQLLETLGRNLQA